MKPPLVSIIILNFNGKDVVQRCIDSVLKSEYPSLEVLLIDNNSDYEEISGLIKKYGRKIQFIRTGTNLGYAAGNNLGAANARGRYLVFLNNDTEVSKDWLKAPIAKLARDKKIAFLQPKINWLIYKTYFEYCGGCGGFIDFFGFPFTRGRVFGSIEEDINQYNDEREIFWATGAVMFCRKDTFEFLGGFDSYFFAQVEDEDLSFRALRAGYKNIYCPTSRVFHLGSFTGNRNIYNKTFFNYRNHLVMLFKNLSKKELAIILPSKIVLDLLASWYYLFGFRSLKMFRAVWAAYIFFVFDLPEVIVKRRNDKIGNFGYPSNTALVYRGSIIFQYYILQKRKWSEIFQQIKTNSKIKKVF